jgi:hypothetical protein
MRPGKHRRRTKRIALVLVVGALIVGAFLAVFGNGFQHSLLSDVVWTYAPGR